MTTRKPASFALPKALEGLLASLSKHYKDQGKETLRQLIVNSRCEVDEGVEHDNWDGGQDGHAIRLYVQEALYHRVMANANDLAAEIRADLGRLATYPGEFIARLDLALAVEAPSTDWREKSDAFLRVDSALEKASSTDIPRLWGAESDMVRIFLSHQATYKVETKKIKEEFRLYGASCFVAHDDIEAGREWQGEIERALESAEVMVVLLTAGIKGSCWCNQEIGIAVGRGVPILSVRLGEDPFGFIGKHQALSISGGATDQIARVLYSFLMTKGPIRDRAEDGFVRTWEKVTNFGQASKMMDVLAALQTPLRPEAMARVKAAFETNDQINGCNGLPRRFRIFETQMQAMSR